MKKNQPITYGMLFGAIFAVAVLTSVITVSITGNLFVNVAKASNTKANSCDADSLCEANALQVTSISTKRDLNQVLVLSSDNGVVRVNGQLETSTISTSGELSISPTKDLLLSTGAKIGLDGTVHVNDFVPFRANLGNAFVCVNNVGDLYRSEDACA